MHLFPLAGCRALLSFRAVYNCLHLFLLEHESSNWIVQIVNCTCLHLLAVELFSLSESSTRLHLFQLNCTCLHLFLLEQENSNWIVGNFQRNWA